MYAERKDVEKQTLLIFYPEKKEEIWLSPVTKAPTPTEKFQKQRDNIITTPHNK